jgi:hypothetical protein
VVYNIGESLLIFFGDGKVMHYSSSTLPGKKDRPRITENHLRAQQWAANIINIIYHNLMCVIYIYIHIYTYIFIYIYSYHISSHLFLQKFPGTVFRWARADGRVHATWSGWPWNSWGQNGHSNTAKDEGIPRDQIGWVV